MILPPDAEEWLVSRAQKRHARLTNRLDQVEGMRKMPDREDINIGAAKETRAVILFADLVKSTDLAIRYAHDPTQMLATLNMIIPTLQDCAEYYGGVFEKNTGDGILAYFGVEQSMTDELAVKYATFAAQAMFWCLENVVNPELRRRNLRPVHITIGADLGNVLIARIGLARRDSPIVAVGLVANRAAKLQESCAPDQFRVGEDFFAATGGDVRGLFRRISPGVQWPFKTLKDLTTYNAEMRQAQEVADAETLRQREAAKEEARRRSIASILPSPLVPPSYIHPTAPAVVDRNRPYQVYVYGAQNRG